MSYEFKIEYDSTSPSPWSARIYRRGFFRLPMTPVFPDHTEFGATPEDVEKRARRWVADQQQTRWVEA